MTVTNENNRLVFVGNGVTLIFAYTFKIFDDADLQVSTIVIATGVETVLTLTTDYTVSGAGDESGGNVTLLITAPPSTDNIVLQRVLTKTQETDYVENDPFPANSHETALDRLTFITQQLQDQLDRAVLSAGNSVLSITLPVPSSGAAIGWNDAATNLVNDPSGIESKVKVDAGATADFIGATASTGVVRSNALNITKTDGGDFVTFDTIQGIASGDSPTFNGLTLSSLTMTNQITSIVTDDTFGSATNSQLVSALAVKTFVNNQVAGKDAFTELVDTPGSFSGSTLRGVRVNAGETALEFAALVTTFLDLTDAPGTV